YFEDGRDACVEFAPAPVREALVRGITDERVAEAEGARHLRISLDEFGEAVPRLRAGRNVGVALEYLGNQRPGEPLAEHGRPAKQRAVAGSELVDALRHERPHCVREIVGSRGLLADAGQLAQDERV